MLSKLSRFLTIVTLTTLTCVITHPASAKPVDSEMMVHNYHSGYTENKDRGIKISSEEGESFGRLNLEELANEAFWQHSGDFFQSSSIGGALNTIFGWESFPQGSFPENEITQDGLLIYTIMTDYFKQLQEREPSIRTRDLANPFNTSLRDNPEYSR